MKLTYLGHSCFKLEDQGFTVVFDPYADGYVPGYGNIREKADLVLCSHEHADHNGRDTVELIPDGINQNPFVITEIPSWHDDAEGSLRGNNLIRVLDNGKYRIAHFGDLGCELTDEQKVLLKDLDVALIPVGGYYTIDAQTAKRIVDSICPKTVIPMHFRGEGFGYDVIAPVEEFTCLYDTVLCPDDSAVTIPDGTPSGVLVLKPQNVQK